MGQRVLVVDDEQVVADTLASIFKMHGYEARATYSAEEALQLIGEWRPDLAILDVVLPRMNGIDLGVLLRAELPSCQVVLISGQTVTSALLESAAKEGHGFQIYAKPMHPSELLKVSAALLSGSGSAADTPQA
jgi:DNA-binding response OmpR family regulator